MRIELRVDRNGQTIFRAECDTEPVAELVPSYHVGQEKTWFALSEGRALQPLLEAVLMPRKSQHAPVLRGVGRALAEHLEDLSIGSAETFGEAAPFS